MGLSEEQRDEAKDLADLKCRIHMDELFERSLPRIIEAAFSAHNSDVEAHKPQLASHAANCPLARKFDRVLYILVGLALGVGGVGGFVAKVLLAF